MFQLGQSYLNAKQTDQAIAAFSQVSQKYATSYLAEWADAMQAGCLMTTQQYAKAEPLLAALVEKYIHGKDAAAKLAEKRKELTAVNPQLVGESTACWRPPT